MVCFSLFCLFGFVSLTDEDRDLAVDADGGLQRLVTGLHILDERVHDVHVRIRVPVQEEAVRQT